MKDLLTVAEIVAAHARSSPDRIAARDSNRSLTFAQWDERASRFAAPEKLPVSATAASTRNWSSVGEAPVISKF